MLKDALILWEDGSTSPIKAEIINGTIYFSLEQYRRLGELGKKHGKIMQVMMHGS